MQGRRIIKTMQNNLNYHLFGGEYDYCSPGMDGYLGAYDEMEVAMRVAETGKYDWAHVIEITPLELKIVNVGRWNKGLSSMIWQANYEPKNNQDVHLRTVCMVMKSGVLMVGKLSSNRDRIPSERMTIMSNALHLLEEIQENMVGMTADMYTVSVYLLRQVISQLIESLKRMGMSYKERLERDQWIKNAYSFLKSTEEMVFSEDRISA